MNQSTYAVLPSRTELQTVQQRTAPTAPQPEPVRPAETADVTIGRKRFLQMLTTACKVAPRHAVRDSMTYVLVSVRCGALDIIATDGDCVLVQSEYDCDRNGYAEIMVDPIELRDYLRKLKTETVRFSIVRPAGSHTGEAEPSATLTSARAEFGLECLDPAAPDAHNRPHGTDHELPRPDTQAQASIDSGAFWRMVGQVSFACDDGGYRFALGGVQAEISTELLTLTATDGRRLATMETACRTVTRDDDTTAGIVPQFAIELAAELAKRSADDLTSFTLGHDYARIIVGNDILHTRLLDGRFPKWRDVVPADANIVHAIELQRTELADSLATARIAKRQNDEKGITLEIEPAATEITLRPDGSRAAVRCPAANHILDPDAELTTAVTLNTEYLREWTTAIDADSLVMGFLPAEIDQKTKEPAQNSAVKMVAENCSTYVLMPLSRETR